MTAQTRTQAHGPSYRRLGAQSWLYSIIAAAAVSVAVFTLWLTGVRIADEGMRPTLSAGDVVLFDRLSKFASLPARGDAYAYVKDGSTVVGRVVGLPGETLCTDGGRLFVNGAALDESRYREPGTPDMQETALAQGEFLILPDERPADMDASEFVVPFEALTGRAALRVSPISKVCFFTAE